MFRFSKYTPGLYRISYMDHMPGNVAIVSDVLELPGDTAPVVSVAVRFGPDVVSVCPPGLVCVLCVVCELLVLPEVLPGAAALSELPEAAVVEPGAAAEVPADVPDPPDDPAPGPPAGPDMLSTGAAVVSAVVSVGSVSVSYVPEADSRIVLSASIACTYAASTVSGVVDPAGYHTFVLLRVMAGVCPLYVDV